ncbi:MAG: hypothetical protein PHH08_01515, partial [Candidatus ainarchaeum sp.]|nr:hypothetical protein [Candidatus ainarchaeum sp.]
QSFDSEAKAIAAADAFQKNMTDTFSSNVKAQLREQMGKKADGITYVFDDLYGTAATVPSAPEFKKAVDDAIAYETTIIKNNSAPTFRTVTEKLTPTRYEVSAKYTGASFEGHGVEVVKTIRGTGTVEKVIGDALLEVEQKKLSQSVLTEASSDAFNGANGFKGTPKYWWQKEFWQDFGERMKSTMKKAFTGANIWSFAKNIGKGIAGGALANLAGFFGWSAYWSAVGSESGAATTSINATGQAQGAGGYVSGAGFVNGIAELKKGSTYRLEITTSGAEGKNRTFNIGILADNSAFDQMAKAVFREPKTADLWESQKCSDFSEKGLEEIGQLRPKFGQTSADQYVIAYWENEMAFAKARLGNTGDLLDDVPEEEIIALMAVKPEKVAGCGMAANWNTKGDAAIRGYIGCTAEKIRQNRPFENYVKSIAGTDTGYFNEVLIAKNKWGQEKITAG